MEKDRIINGDVRELHKYDLRKYQIVTMDPPWWYADRHANDSIGACRQYNLMKLEELKSIPIMSLAAERCHLYMWTTAPLLDQAFELLSAWGFTYATVVFVWIKTNPKRWADALRQAQFVTNLREWLRRLTFFGPGYYTGSNAEFVLHAQSPGLVLLARNGKPFKHAEGHKPSQVVYAPLSGEHSQKPEEIQNLIEYMYPGVGPKLEVFARRPRRGWDVLGNEVNKFEEYINE